MDYSDSDSDGPNDHLDILTLTGVSLQDFASSYTCLSFRKPKVNVKNVFILPEDEEDVLGTLAILGLRTSNNKHRKILWDVIMRTSQKGFSYQGRCAMTAESIAQMAELCTAWECIPDLEMDRLFFAGLLFSEVAMLVCDHDWEQNKFVCDFLSRNAGTMVCHYSKYLSPGNSSYSNCSDRFILRLMHAVVTFSACSHASEEFFSNSNVVSFMMRPDFDADAEIMEKFKLPLVDHCWTKHKAFFKNVPRSLFQTSNAFLMMEKHMTADCTYAYECAMKTIDDYEAFFEKTHPTTRKRRFKIAVECYAYYVPALRISTFAEYAVTLPVSTDLLLAQDPDDKTPTVLFLLCNKRMDSVLRRIVLTRARHELKLDLSTDENQAHITVARQLVQHEESTGIMTEEQAGICFAYIDKVYA